MQDQNRDRWDKADIILKPVGGLLTALAVAALGFFGSRALDRRQAEDNRTRLFTELMNKRQETETAFRKDMFGSLLGTSLTSGAIGYEQRVLNMELLSYNFNEDLDLSPAFQLLYKQVTDSRDSRAPEWEVRLESAAGAASSRQLAALEDVGGKLDATLDLKELESKPAGVTLIDSALSLRTKVANEPDTKHFKVEAFFIDRIRKRIRVKLEVRTPPKNNGDTKGSDVETLYSVFWISAFDFPMLNNTRLPHGQRCAIVLRKFGDLTAEFTLVYFPENWREARVVEMARILNGEP